ncbi:hypothetical protein D3C76_1398350 [compost metagenome]
MEPARGKYLNTIKKIMPGSEMRYSALYLRKLVIRLWNGERSGLLAGNAAGTWCGINIAPLVAVWILLYG